MGGNRGKKGKGGLAMEGGRCGGPLGAVVLLLRYLIQLIESDSTSMRIFWWWQKVGTSDTSTFAAFSRVIRCASVFVLPGPNYPRTRVQVLGGRQKPGAPPGYEINTDISWHRARPTLDTEYCTVFFRVIRFFAKTGRYLRLGGAWSLKWPLRLPQFS